MSYSKRCQFDFSLLYIRLLYHTSKFQQYKRTDWISFNSKGGIDHHAFLIYIVETRQAMLLVVTSYMAYMLSFPYFLEHYYPLSLLLHVVLQTPTLCMHACVSYLIFSTKLGTPYIIYNFISWFKFNTSSKSPLFSSKRESFKL